MPDSFHRVTVNAPSKAGDHSDLVDNRSSTSLPMSKLDNISLVMHIVKGGIGCFLPTVGISVHKDTATGVSIAQSVYVQHVVQPRSHAVPYTYTPKLHIESQGVQVILNPRKPWDGWEFIQQSEPRAASSLSLLPPTLPWCRSIW